MARLDHAAFLAVFLTGFLVTGFLLLLGGRGLEDDVEHLTEVLVEWAAEVRRPALLDPGEELLLFLADLPHASSAR